MTMSDWLIKIFSKRGVIFTEAKLGNGYRNNLLKDVLWRARKERAALQLLFTAAHVRL